MYAGLLERAEDGPFSGEFSPNGDAMGSGQCFCILASLCNSDLSRQVSKKLVFAFIGESDWRVSFIRLRDKELFPQLRSGIYISQHWSLSKTHRPFFFFPFVLFLPDSSNLVAKVAVIYPLTPVSAYRRGRSGWVQRG